MNKHFAVSAYNMHGIATIINALWATGEILGLDIVSVVGQPSTTRLQALIHVKGRPSEPDVDSVDLDKVVGDVVNRVEFNS